MLAFQWENPLFKIKQLTKNIADTDGINVFFYKCFGSWNKEVDIEDILC